MINPSVLLNHRPHPNLTMGVGDGFPNYISRLQEIIPRINKWDYTKLKQSPEWERTEEMQESTNNT